MNMFRKFKNIFRIKNNEKKFSTVHYAFPIVIVSTIFAGLAAVISDSSSYVTISTPVTSTVRDQEFFITVAVTAHVPINAIDLNIAYSEDTLEILSIDTGRSVITLWTETPYARDGKIFLSGGTFRKGFLGEHEVARIKARAKEAGDARLFVSNTQFIAGDGQGTVVESSQRDGNNEVQIVVLGDSGVIKGEATISIITDTNGDGKVDIRDISAFMTAWFTRSSTYDFNHDGKMTFRDFSILLADSFFR
jgi:hypothetical protein